MCIWAMLDIHIDTNELDFDAKFALSFQRYTDGYFASTFKGTRVVGSKDSISVRFADST